MTERDYFKSMAEQICEETLQFKLPKMINVRLLGSPTYNLQTFSGDISVKEDKVHAENAGTLVEDGKLKPDEAKDASGAFPLIKIHSRTLNWDLQDMTETRLRPMFKMIAEELTEICADYYGHMKEKIGGNVIFIVAPVEGLIMENTTRYSLTYLVKACVKQA